VLAPLVDVPEHRWPVRKPFRLDDCSWVSNKPQKGSDPVFKWLRGRFPAI
jgi:hypothetical protein